MKALCPRQEPNLSNIRSLILRVAIQHSLVTTWNHSLRKFTFNFRLEAPASFIIAFLCFPHLSCFQGYVHSNFCNISINQPPFYRLACLYPEESKMHGLFYYCRNCKVVVICNMNVPSLRERSCLWDMVIFRILYIKYLTMDKSEESVTILCNEGWDRSVVIATGYELESTGFIPCMG
jgi:hypothetical protein